MSSPTPPQQEQQQLALQACAVAELDTSKGALWVPEMMETPSFEILRAPEEDRMDVDFNYSQGDFRSMLDEMHSKALGTEKGEMQYAHVYHLFFFTCILLPLWIILAINFWSDIAIAFPFMLLMIAIWDYFSIAGLFAQMEKCDEGVAKIKDKYESKLARMNLMILYECDSIHCWKRIRDYRLKYKITVVPMPRDSTRERPQSSNTSSQTSSAASFIRNMFRRP